MTINVKNLSTVIDGLHTWDKTFSLDAIYVQGKLGARLPSDEPTPPATNPRVRWPETAPPCWCIEGFIVQLVDPDRLVRWQDSNGAMIIKWANHPQPTATKRPHPINPDYVPEWWWQDTFGLSEAELMPPEVFNHEGYNAHRLQDRSGLPEHWMWEMSDQCGVESWRWLARHWKSLRDQQLNAGVQTPDQE